MKEWIEENINPPGIKRNNRGGIYGVVGEAFGLVREDALRAFNAYFPYLADEKKLAEHGKALLVPHLLHDTQEEYRNRVATASFFLTRSGERSYILGQLQERFGERYLLIEEFLQIYVKVLELSDAERIWILEFLDSSLDPNILLTVAEWFRYIELVVLSETLEINTSRQDYDKYSYPLGMKCDGRWLCDWGKETLCDGTWVCDGSVMVGITPKRGTVLDTAQVSVFCDGSWLCDGTQNCSGYKMVVCDDVIPPEYTSPIQDGVSSEFSLTSTINFVDEAHIIPRCDGSWLCDGSNLASMIDAPMILKIIKPNHVGGEHSVPSVCGTIIVGLYDGYDGFMVGEDIVKEEVI
jgi:hypothetical protein